jgi:enoyl-CoA hydratase
MQFTNIICEIEKSIATVTINRPKALNALNRETLEELICCFSELQKDSTVLAVIITGTGEKAFIAGADISCMHQFDALAGRQFGRLGQQAMAVVETFSRPVIAAVNGFALGGGCELSLACDIRIASENAKFGQPEVNLGVTPGFGGSQRLPRLVGKGLASELLYTGDIIDAGEACRIGLVNRVVPLSQLMSECIRIAEKISAKGPVAVKLCKELVNGGMEMDLARACMYEADLFGMCFATGDQKEGMNAFLEKRSPDFKGQ